MLLVMLAHAGVPHVSGGGESGVTMFFVLSGFLITSLLLAEQSRSGRIAVRSFYRRRVLRLLPALVVLVAAVTVFAALSVFVGFSDSPGGVHALVGEVFAALFFVANWFRVAGHRLGHLHHTWTLGIEEQFYLLWPGVLVLLVPFTRHRRRWAVIGLAALAACSAAERFLLWHGPASVNRVYFGTDTHADALLLGCLLGIVLSAGVALRPKPWVLASGIAALGYVTYRVDVPFIYTWSPTISAVGALVLVAYAAELRPGRSLLESRPLVHAGKISYGLYLWHIPLFDVLQPHLQSLPLAAQVAVLFATAWSFALVSFRFVERPFLRLKDRGRQKQPTLTGGEAVVPGPPI